MLEAFELCCVQWSDRMFWKVYQKQHVLNDKVALNVESFVRWS